MSAKNTVFLYNSRCIDVKSHKCIAVEYKVGHSGYFGTKYVFLSLLEIQQHSGMFTDSGEQG